MYSGPVPIGYDLSVEVQAICLHDQIGQEAGLCVPKTNDRGIGLWQCSVCQRYVVISCSITTVDCSEINPEAINESKK